MLYINLSIFWKVLNRMTEKTLRMKNNPIPEDLFKILACPLCKNDLKYNKDKTKLVCSKCKKEYPIKEGVAVLLPK